MHAFEDLTDRWRNNILEYDRVVCQRKGMSRCRVQLLLCAYAVDEVCDEDQRHEPAQDAPEYAQTTCPAG